MVASKVNSMDTTPGHHVTKGIRPFVRALGLCMRSVHMSPIEAYALCVRSKQWRLHQSNRMSQLHIHAIHYPKNVLHERCLQVRVTSNLSRPVSPYDHPLVGFVRVRLTV